MERRISKMGEHKSQRQTNTDRHCTLGVGARGGGGGVEVAAADKCPQSAIKKETTTSKCAMVCCVPVLSCGILACCPILLSDAVRTSLVMSCPVLCLPAMCGIISNASVTL